MKVPIQAVRAGMVIAKDVYTSERIKLIQCSTLLTNQHVEKLKNHHIRHVEISNGNQFPSLMSQKTDDLHGGKKGQTIEIEQQVLRTLLRKIPLFADFTKEQLSFVIQNSMRKIYAAKQVVFVEKDKGDTFLIILRGSIKIYRRSTDGKEKILSLLKDGDSFGELSLIDGHPRSASAQTLEETELLLFTQEKFFALLQSSQELTRTILMELSRRLRETNNQVFDLIFYGARTRVIKSLIQIANQFGERFGHVLRVKMPLHRDELAQMSGVEREELNAVIRELENKEILRMRIQMFELHMNRLQS